MTEETCCPYCGYVLRDLWDYYMDDGKCVEADCGSCGREFLLKCYISITYSTEAIPDKEKT